MTTSPLFGGLYPLHRARVPLEVLAGVTLAALAIPEALGYASIAGLPAVIGLYTLLMPPILFAVFGSSRHLVVGADSATAAILAGGLTALAASGSSEYMALAAAAALVTAVWLLLARTIGLAFLADFLSRSVLVGFLTGVGIQVALSQVGTLLGVTSSGTGTLDKALSTVSHVSQLSLPTVAVAVCVLAIIVGLRRVRPMLPGALVAVVASILASYALDLEALGVTRLGPVPGGLPTFGVPDVGWNSIQALLPTTIGLFVVILAQSAATSRAYAQQYDEPVSQDTDLVGLALANVGAALSGAFVVNGSPTKTQLVDTAGGRTQLAPLASSLVAHGRAPVPNGATRVLARRRAGGNRFSHRSGAHRPTRPAAHSVCAAARVLGGAADGGGRDRSRRRAGHHRGHGCLTCQPHAPRLQPAQQRAGATARRLVAGGSRHRRRPGGTRRGGLPLHPQPVLREYREVSGRSPDADTTRRSGAQAAVRGFHRDR
jgi:hypothetical protein